MARKLKPYAILPWILQMGLLFFLVKPLYRFFLKVRIIGLDSLANCKSNFIFASNHSSELDPTIIPYCMPMFSHSLPMFYVSKNKDFYDRSGWRSIFYGGLIFKMLGAFPVVSGLKNYSLSMNDHAQIIKDGYSLHIFPEGLRTIDGKLGQGRGGVSYLSMDTNTPIIPVGIVGLFDLDLKKFFSKNSEVIVSFGRPMIFEKVSDYRDNFMIHKVNSKKIMDEIMLLINNVS